MERILLGPTLLWKQRLVELRDRWLNPPAWQNSAWSGTSVFETKNGSYVRRSGIYISTTPPRFSILSESAEQKRLTGVSLPGAKRHRSVLG